MTYDFYYIYQVETKKPRLVENNKENKPFDKNGKQKSTNGKFASKNKFDKNNKKNLNGSASKPVEKMTPAEKKELKKQRRQKKIGDKYDLTINIKKIWETLRKSETTDDTKKKLCSTLYENVKGKISEVDIKYLINKDKKIIDFNI